VSGQHFSTADTIAAIATPPGRGGLGIVRLSGPDAHRIACTLAARDEPFTPRYATLVTIRLKPDPTTDTADPTTDVASGVGRASAAHTAIDQAIVTYFQAPASYTGDHVVEISAHGSPVVLTQIIEAALRAGARLAARGEFTLRAFLNSRIDLTQAEAVADLIDAATPLQARAAFDQLDGTLTMKIAEIDRALFDLIARLEASVDFPEEGYHFVEPGELAQAIDGVLSCVDRLLHASRAGRLIREGFQIAIVGPPNVGKSSLFNALVGSERAIVTDVPGTTRDLITETIDLDGLRATLVDTAGVRDTFDAIELEGVSRSRGTVAVADLILLVADRSRPADDAWRLAKTLKTDVPVVIVANKSDLAPAWTQPSSVNVSSMTGSGLHQLRREISLRLQVGDPADRPAITNVRHIALVEQARNALARHPPTAARCRKSSFWRISRRRAHRSRRSPVAGRPRTCWRTSSSVSASVSDPVKDASATRTQTEKAVQKWCGDSTSS
jgi:tRNA modification GTPase